MPSGLHVKYRYCCLILMKIEIFWIISSKILKILNFMKNRPMGAELFHACRNTNGRTDRRTDMKRLIVALRNFANAPKNAYDHRGIKLVEESVVY